VGGGDADRHGDVVDAANLDDRSRALVDAQVPPQPDLVPPVVLRSGHAARNVAAQLVDDGGSQAGYEVVRLSSHASTVTAHGRPGIAHERTAVAGACRAFPVERRVRRW
jgi:hypothetical protein